jgi:hypothetical protein
LLSKKPIQLSVPSALARSGLCQAAGLMVFAMVPTWLFAQSNADVASITKSAFTEVAGSVGIDYVQLSDQNLQSAIINAIHQTGGAAARDYDGDGWVDLVVTRFDADPILYRNIPDPDHPGQRRFEDVTARSGIAGGVVVAGNGVAWGDVDNDGRADLYFTTFSNRYCLLMQRPDGTFVEEAVARGADQFVPTVQGVSHAGTSVSFGDYDCDGFLDLATGEWLTATPDEAQPIPNVSKHRFQLLRNLGRAKPGHFENVTDAAGTNTFPSNLSASFTPRFTDLDSDGWPDLAVTSDSSTSRLFWNNGDGTFSDGTTTSAVGTDESGMGSSVGDFDRDGDLDWFVSSIGRHFSQTGNRLYLNRMIRPRQLQGAVRSFADATDLGVREGAWGWGCSFIDYDNDAWLDLVLTNGILNRHIAHFVDDPMRFYRNNGGRTGTPSFDECAQQMGLTDTRSGKGLLIFDFDNDGDQDIFIVNNFSKPVLYRNNVGSRNRWLKLQLVGSTSNRDAAGALVKVVDRQLGGEQKPLVWEVNASSTFLAQSEPTVFFGLGKDFTGTVDSLSIRWPGSNVEQKLTNVPIDQFHRITEGRQTITPVTSE